jgi:Ca2+/H+ antiporter, TMEM165/GDT1 family
MEALLTAYGIVFLAELGDKSMLFSLTAATRYRWWMVLIAVSAATAVLMALAVIVGGVAGELLPDRAVAIVAALLFIGFGIWTLLGDEDDADEDLPQAQRSAVRAMVALAALFFVLEFGDKTQVATLSLASLRSGEAVFVWLGATAGMVTVNALAIAVGSRLNRYLPERVVQVASGALFIVIGLLTLAIAFL